VEAVASWHTSRLIDRVCVGGNFLVLKEEGSVFKGGAFFKSIEVVFEGSSGQSSGSMGVVLCIWEVVRSCWQLLLLVVQLFLFVVILAELL
jgi:hypothetical protein